MEVYHKALDLKPNYVRVWVNLGIAHAYKFEYKVKKIIIMIFNYLNKNSLLLGSSQILSKRFKFESKCRTFMELFRNFT